MGVRQVIMSGKLYDDQFVYEGEELALEYPSGELVSIPRNKIYMFLKDAKLPDGEPCKVLLEKSPLTRLDIIVREPEEKENTHEVA